MSLDATQIPAATADLPTIAQIRDFAELDPGHVADDELIRMWQAGLDRIVRSCRRHIPLDAEGQPTGTGWPAPLVEAALRRLQRAVAARPLPLGYLNTASEYGPARIPNYDLMIEELEGPFRAVVFGGPVVAR